ncbi:HAMP domain-containing sensor histidine kinase [Porphyromonas sp. COT-239 OH1446]|uniref:sensor histidine kinase n=1 Tax=Porphyromonas sp. COT-239 OH1446 TaxID=1515613 RepID=UPI000B17ED98|nr:HAMP domain-containing sensor histidine kinase [Porphyromonas sp. COT-239 OH1446]
MDKTFRIKRMLLNSGIWINKHSYVRMGLITISVALAVISLLVSDRLISKMAEEERRKLEIWAFATQAINTPDMGQTFNYLSRVLESNTTIPMIVTSQEGQILNYRNLDIPRRNPERYLYDKLQEFRAGYPPILVEYPVPLYIYYSDSNVLRYLVLLPYIQQGIFLFILAAAIVALISLKRMDQNRLWEGLSRETAHQLGTPISSLMAWKELLASSDIDPMIVHEMSKDINRLETIADRFQKVGSIPKLAPIELGGLVCRAINYMKPRISSQVAIEVETREDDPIIISANESLMAWVFENLIKNAVDAMQGKGTITVAYRSKGRQALIDITDTGRGIPRSKIKSIFNPGYTTRQRGWGLGLSLARRIVEDYHRGRIYVKRSEVGVGTTFRIEMRLDGED